RILQTFFGVITVTRGGLNGEVRNSVSDVRRNRRDGSELLCLALPQFLDRGDRALRAGRERGRGQRQAVPLHGRGAAAAVLRQPGQVWLHVHSVGVVVRRLRERGRVGRRVRQPLLRRGGDDAAGQLRIQFQVRLGQRSVRGVVAAQPAARSKLVTEVCPDR